uniref:histidine kinase n=1 Tax=Eiseniibacteriota bacterium TaxID=2212470 RepID=A0A832MKL4_UNCEI
MRVLRTVSVRLVAGTLLLLLVSFALLSTVLVRYFSDRLTDQAVDAAHQISEFMAGSTRYSMLLNRKQDAYQSMRRIARSPGVVGVRIFNKVGVVTFSSRAEEVGGRVDPQAEACVGCHQPGAPRQSIDESGRVRLYRTPEGMRVVGVITPVRNDPSCAGAGCHPPPAERPILGVFDVRTSLAGVDAAIGEARRRLFAGAAVAFVVVGVAAVLLLDATVRRPIRALARGTRELAAGHLEYRIPALPGDEFGALGASFNAMAASLLEAQQENARWSRTLEERVREKTEALERIHRQILHVEKMASLGALAASVAHEVNNPLSGILTYARLNRKRIERSEDRSPLLRQISEDLELIARESERCGQIVRNLLLFSRAPHEGELRPVAVGEVLQRALALVAHRLQLAEVRVETRVEPPDLTVTGDEGQLEQALVALVVNAQEAMPDGGTLTVTAEALPDGAVRLAVADTGSGIAAADLPHLFEPFFTTKPRGQGVGLGLSVVYGIVQRHGGTIDVRSEPGRGSVFTIVLPPPGATAVAAATAASPAPGTRNP